MSYAVFGCYTVMCTTLRVINVEVRWCAAFRPGHARGQAPVADHAFAGHRVVSRLFVRFVDKCTLRDNRAIAAQKIRHVNVEIYPYWARGGHVSFVHVRGPLPVPISVSACETVTSLTTTACICSLQWQISHLGLARKSRNHVVNMAAGSRTTWRTHRIFNGVY